MEVVVTTGASRAKLQSNHHHQQTNTQFLQVRCPSCRPTNSAKALKGKYTIVNWQKKTSSAKIDKCCHVKHDIVQSLTLSNSSQS